MMKKYMMMAAAVLLMTLAGSCQPDNPDDPGSNQGKGSIEGVWELSKVETKAVDVFGTSVSVYVSFASGKFELYQQIGSGRYEKFTGTYSFSGDKLSGKYDDGKSLGSNYTVTLGGDTLVLETEGGKEKDTYRKISAIPQSVIDSVF